MTLATFWSSITGQTRIKEIAPANQTSWLDRGRPTTSAGARSAKRFKSEEFDAETIDWDKKTTASVGRKFTRLGRSLSRARPKAGKSKLRPDTSKQESNVRLSTFGAPYKDPPVEKVPEVPLAAILKHKSLPAPPDDPGTPVEIPGTAVTTDATQAFQPIGHSAASPMTEEILTEASKAVTRKRSQSRSQDNVAQTASYFQITPRTTPLPPPSVPLPPIPTSDSTCTTEFTTPAEYPASPQRSNVLESTGPKRAVQPTDVTYASPNGITSTQGSILEAYPFPQVPSPTRESASSPQTDERSPDLETGIDNIVLFSMTSTTSSKSPEKRRPDPIRTSDHANFHTPKDSAIGTPRTPIRGSGQGNQGIQKSPRILETVEDDSVCLSNEQQRDWDRVAQMMELMAKEDTDGVAQTLQSSKLGEGYAYVDKSSNQQALAALEFGLLT